MKHQYRNRTTIWTSESGTMEFFIFGAYNQDNNGPKRLVRKLSIITGYLPLPPYHSLGYHYSKWEPISTHYLLSLLEEFNTLQMPVDNLWLDIEYAKERRYFQFDETYFKNL